MTGKRYYITTLGDWKRHASRFAASHFILWAPAVNEKGTAHSDFSTVQSEVVPEEMATPILALIEADEGVHLTLEEEPRFELLPHALTQQAISELAQSALAVHGVAPGATTFDAAEAVAQIHPLLRHRVF